MLSSFFSSKNKSNSIEKSAKSPTEYVFTNEWFSIEEIIARDKILGHLKGQPSLKYLEIGTFEGRSLFWMLDHILTAKSSRATCIDVAEKPVRARLKKNISLSGKKSAIKLISKTSFEGLIKLQGKLFDIIYIDAAHDMKSVIQDAVLAWPLLKSGGYLIFDDYWPLPARFPEDLIARSSIETFLAGYRRELDYTRLGKEVFIQKKSITATCHIHNHSFWSAYEFEWYNSILKKNNEVVYLSEEETNLLELTLRLAHQQNNYSVCTSFLNPKHKAKIKYLEQTEFLKLQQSFESSKTIWIGKNSLNSEIHIQNVDPIYFLNNYPQHCSLLAIDFSCVAPNWEPLFIGAWKNLKPDGAILLSKCHFSEISAVNKKFLLAFSETAEIYSDHNNIIFKYKKLENELMPSLD